MLFNECGDLTLTIQGRCLLLQILHKAKTVDAVQMPVGLATKVANDFLKIRHQTLDGRRHDKEIIHFSGNSETRLRFRPISHEDTSVTVQALETRKRKMKVGDEFVEELWSLLQLVRLRRMRVRTRGSALDNLPFSKTTP
mmetsp:Transcript_8449/g.26050  ORF Transcript_8449/g.26050 Transcript_8449/m.26050 type:complete len:140 (+) Transcript_8449:387-806(+)